MEVSYRLGVRFAGASVGVEATKRAGFRSTMRGGRAGFGFRGGSVRRKGFEEEGGGALYRTGFRSRGSAPS